ncbi:hypothetical protein ABZU78_12920 [Rhodococcus erythropolis]|uniref:hypothetical protein n=1 Tax=Rhodococcus erythropolis TaxID=1833 RepID=UPI0033B8E670
MTIDNDLLDRILEKRFWDETLEDTVWTSDFCHEFLESEESLHCSSEYLASASSYMNDLTNKKKKLYIPNISSCEQKLDTVEPGVLMSHAIRYEIKKQEYLLELSEVRVKAEKFPVVRGTGDIQDLRIADFGSSFLEWSTGILNDYDLDKNRISRVMLVPNNFNQLRQIGELEILDAVRIYYKNEEHAAFIRKIEWYVQNNHIRVEIYFQREKRQSAWLPSIESVDSFTNLWFDTW